MLQTPTLINALRYMPLPQPSQVGGVIHANLDSIRAELGDEGREQRCAGGMGSFAGSTQGVGQYAQLELGVVAERLL